MFEVDLTVLTGVYAEAGEVVGGGVAVASRGWGFEDVVVVGSALSFGSFGVVVFECVDAVVGVHGRGKQVEGVPACRGHEGLRRWG